LSTAHQIITHRFTMTPEQILHAVDLTDQIALLLPSGGVAMTLCGSSRVFWAFRKEQRFLLVAKVTVGARGKIRGHVFLSDTSITPAVDAIRVGELHDFSSTGIFPIAGLVWRPGEMAGPQEKRIMEQMKRRMVEMPEDVDFFANHFTRGGFDTPAHSIKSIEGGAPGLRR
jgi:hypothetical protein